MPLSALKSAARPLKPAFEPLETWWRAQTLPAEAKAAKRRDREARPLPDPGGEAAIAAALDWLGAAQDNSATKDGGAARDYSHVTGWAASYPETTGYIIPTLLDQAKLRGDENLRARARRMLDFCVSIQFPDGGFQGGTIGQEPRVPVTFNTGQILMGLAAGVREFGDAYRDPMRRAADWLANSLDADGCWRAHRTPFATPTDKAYETHVSRGLYDAARVEANPAWIDAANRQVDWALTKQRENGWLDECCLSIREKPLTHTLGYALRGIVDAWDYTGERRFLEGAQSLGRALRGQIHQDGYLAGRFDAEWSEAADWVCLTGTAQIAESWLMLMRADGDIEWRVAAERALAYVRRRIALDGPVETRGAVAGSFPIDGHYVTHGYPNWAAKFFIDAQQRALDLRAEW